MVSERVRSRMEELGLTYEALAEKAHVSVGTVKRAVTESSASMNLQSLIPIAEVLDMSIDEMVGLRIEAEKPLQKSPVVMSYQESLDSIQAANKESLDKLLDRHQNEIVRLESSYQRMLDGKDAWIQRQRSERFVLLGIIAVLSILVILYLVQDFQSVQYGIFFK